MRTTGLRLRTLALVVTSLATVIGSSVGSAHADVICLDASLQGCFEAPYSEGAGARGTYAEAPPATVAEAGEFPTAVSAVVTPDGNIVYWDGLSGLQDSHATLALDAGRTADPDRSRILDYSASLAFDEVPEIYEPATNPTGGSEDNLFCADQRLLADGRVIVAGGTSYETTDDIPDEIADPEAEVAPGYGAPDGLAELYGSSNTRLFSTGDGGAWDYDANLEMHYRRWYPTLVTLASGDMLVAGGVSKLLWNSNLHDGDSDADPDDPINERATGPVPLNVPQTETFDGTGWTENGASGEVSLPLFARMHLLPSGEVFYSGAGQMWGPAGEAVDQAGWNYKKTYDPVANAWRDLDTGVLGARNGAFSALLPLRPDAEGDYEEAKVLLAGGTLGTSPGYYLATPFTEIVTLADTDAETAGWESSTELGPDLNNARWYSSGVVLPNGDVLALNGADKDEVVAPGTEQAVHQVELFDGEQWIPLASGARDRTYHNSAILLADGSVLLAGHSPINTLYGGQGDNGLHSSGLTANNLRDPSFERFYPPYLFNADGSFATRPEITNLPSGTWEPGAHAFAVNDTSVVDKVVLSRLPSVTHTTDADQRTVELPITAKAGDSVHVEVTANNGALPPGYYYLFALTADGVPSVAKIIRVLPA
ncbi:MAG TPA: galactose oxidase early set domain-containing protein [Actinomycetota bacterium]